MPLCCCVFDGLDDAEVIINAGDEDEESKNPIIVIDSGSFMIKAGVSDEYGEFDSEDPKVVFPALVGVPKDGTGVSDDAPNGYFVGREAKTKASSLKLNCPIKDGIVTGADRRVENDDWDHMEKIWNHTFYQELCEAPEDCKVMLSVNPGHDAMRIATLMFETFSVRAVALELAPWLALHAQGRDTGVGVVIGEQVVHAMAFSKSRPLHDTAKCSLIGGQDLTEITMELLAKKGTNLDADAARGVKEKTCYVAQSSDVNSEDVKETTHQLPDGKTITVGKDRFLVPEALFNPSSYPVRRPDEAVAIQDLVEEVIMSAEQEERHELLAGVVLAGGSSAFPGMRERMKKELEAKSGLVKTCSMARASARVGVVVAPMHSYFGAISLASMSTYNGWTNKADFDNGLVEVDENGKLKTGFFLKAGWNSAEDPDTGKTYYFNAKTGETTWDAPVR